MSFIWPSLLFLLFLIPLSVLYYLRLQRRRQRITASYGSLGLVQNSLGARPGFRRHIPPLFFLAGLALLVIAMARPQAMVSLPKVQGTVMLAFDVSGSMAATDLQPTRMEAAKAAAKAFVQRQPLSVQIGVVAFSDSGLAVQLPTNEQAAILAAIDRLAPQRGTSLGNGILSTLKAVDARARQIQQEQSGPYPLPTEPTPTPVPKGTYTPVVMILLTDGENNEAPDPLAAAQAAADRGVRIYTVGLGSAAGTNLKINGITVHTQLDEGLLQQISQITGGAYYNAESTQDLYKIYDTIGSQLTIKPEKTEITALFAGASIAILLFGGILSLLWFSRLP